MGRTPTLPRLVLERAERVRKNHAASKLTPDNVARMLAAAEPARQPNVYRVFAGRPPVALPTKLLDAPVETVPLLRDGRVMEESFLSPPQEAKTLASWLFMADGIARQPQPGQVAVRTCPSAGGTFPYELYVAAIAIEGLEPGLYHYQPREFCLRKLRDGAVTLSYLKKGRPDLEFIKGCPGAVLVSTVFSRASWRFRQRGYRSALLDAGHMVQNLVTSGQGLGMQTLTHLRLNDAALRELIGLGVETEYAQAEAVQAMVIWADRARGRQAAKAPAALAPDPAKYITSPAVPIASPLSSGVPMAEPAPWETSTVMPALQQAPMLEPIARPAAEAVSYGSIVATHQDCVDPGGTVRDLRPPLTEIGPLPPGFATQQFPQRGDLPLSANLRKVLFNRRSPSDFIKDGIPIDLFMTFNTLAFRGGTFMPLAPGGPHAALVRPFWIVHSVSGMAPGVWYYDVIPDRWALLREGLFRNDTKKLCIGQEQCFNAAAVCFMCINLQGVMNHAGPDLYRLGHLESGAVAHRLSLTAASLDLAANGIGAFYDDELKLFLGLKDTGWEVVYAVALGDPVGEDGGKGTTDGYR